MNRHPTTRTWAFPPERRAPDATVNLRELAARPGRFEHHLMVIGRVGVAQIELVTASEPLFFSHANISDEYAMSLLTGDPLLDGFPFRTFLSDDHGELVGRIRHQAGQMVLHPHGWLHWPGKLRPPYEMPAFPGARRTGLSVVFCASEPTAPEDRPLSVSEGLGDNVKAYGDALPFHLVDTRTSGAQWLGQVGEARMDLLVDPDHVDASGYILVLEAADDSPWFACDFAHVTEPRDLVGIKRALHFHGAEVGAPPPSWTDTPAAPFAPFEDDDRLPLPISVGAEEALTVAVDTDTTRVKITIGELTRSVPRHWLARMLFRIALHDYALGYLETYEGFFYDDRDGHVLGLREGARSASTAFDAVDIKRAVESLYRAVATSDYTERLS